MSIKTETKTGIDVHCHFEYIENMEEVAKEVRERMLAAICSVPKPKDFDKILELRQRFDDCIFVCLGFHPEVAFEYSNKQREDVLEKICDSRKNIVGIGEVGLDYSWIKEESKREKTKDIFIQFIDLAKELRLPLVIHARNSQDDKSRDAFSDCLKVLTDNNAKHVVMHCFSGNESTLQHALEQNYWISYATIICKSDKHKRLATKTPLEQMLLETDSPWLDPDSRDLVNRPWKIERSAEVIAEIKGKTKDEILKITTENAKKAFNLHI
jgi:TatD DNase family protein